MKTLLKFFFCFALCVISLSLSAQIFVEDFGTVGGGPYSNATTTLTDQCGGDGVDTGDYYGVVLSADINQTYSGFTGAFLAAQDIDGAPCTTGTAGADITGISIAGETGVVVCFDIAEGTAGDGNEDWDADSNVTVSTSVDGASDASFTATGGGATNTAPGVDCDGDGTADGAPLTDAATTFCLPLTATGNTLDINISISGMGAGDEDVALDNIAVYSDANPAPNSNTGCVTCDLVVTPGAPACDAGNATYSVTVSFTGGGTDTYTITPNAGTVTLTNDPSVMAMGTFDITGIPVGTALGFDITTAAGCAVPVNVTSPTCSGLTACPAPVWEAVDVVTSNAFAPNWTTTANGWSMNGFCGGGCAEQTDQWLVYGPLDLTSTTALNLLFDSSEGFGSTILDFKYTSAYTGCPADAANAWTSVGTLTDPSAAQPESIDFGTAAAGLTGVYIAIEYTDDGADGYSAWDLSNFALEADTCPTVGTPVVSACTPAACSITGLAVTGACQGADYVYDVTFTVSGSSGPYDVIDVATGFVLASGTGSPVQGTIVGATGGAGFDIEVRDAADPTCVSAIASLLPLDCSAPSTCPASAKINEFHYDNAGTDINEFVEIALPTGADPTQVQVDLYNGNGGTSYSSTVLAASDFVSSDGTLDYYVWNVSLQNGNDGIATSCLDGTQYMFITYEGAFMATDGPFNGVMGTDVGVDENNNTTLDTQSIMCDGAGGYLTNCTADAGSANDLSSCGSVVVNGCTDMAACNFDPTATADDGSCFSVGDTCDDMDPNTMNDVYTDCMTCAGTAAMCAITIDSEVVSACDNGGTPNDATDDTFTVTVTATVTNGSGMYTLSDGTTTSPATASGTAIVMGPYPADGTTTVSFTAADMADATCTAASAAASGPVNSCDLPANCSPNVGTYPWNGQ